MVKPKGGVTGDEVDHVNAYDTGLFAMDDENEGRPAVASKKYKKPKAKPGSFGAYTNDL